MGNVSGYSCPYCGEVFPLIEGVTYSSQAITFVPGKTDDENGILRIPVSGSKNMNGHICETIWVSFYFCPNCNRSALSFRSVGGSLQENLKYHYPLRGENNYPEYVPISIRNDYEEACAIVDLSPKASATLSRRCLQGIIRNFWGITPKFWDEHEKIKKECSLRDSNKANLWQEIKAVEHCSGIDATLIAAFRRLKDIGNIGAHPENDVNLVVDVEPHEAETLIALIELIIRKTYIQRNDDETLLQKVEGIAKKKTDQRGDDHK
jgi:hypothetical protein